MRRVLGFRQYKFVTALQKIEMYYKCQVCPKPGPRWSGPFSSSFYLPAENIQSNVGHEVLSRLILCLQWMGLLSHRGLKLDGAIYRSRGNL